MQSLGQDLRHGARTLRANPGFTAIAVITLALGIGANTTIFSVVKAVVLQPLPYPEAERLVRLWESNPGRGWPEFSASVPNFEDWRMQQSVYEELAAYEFTTFNLTGDGEPLRVAALGVTANLFPALGFAPALGRGFLPEEERAGCHRVAIVSDGLWQRRFGGDPGLIGRQIQLDGEGFTVVGVMPPRFRLTPGTEMWVPLMRDAAVQPWRADRSNHNLAVVGRLESGVGIEQAQAEMDTIARRLEEQHPASNAGWGVRMRTFYDWLVPEPIRRSMFVLFGSVAFVLLIACANVANLLLTRAAGRQRGLAIRAALGAGRLRLMRQLLTESLLLTTLGGAAGVLLALWATPLLRSVTALDIPRLAETRLDAGVLGFTLVVSLLTGILFGLAPAWQASRLDLNLALKEGGRRGAAAPRQRLRGALVVSEVALALVLLLGAGLMLRSFVRLQEVELGFAPENVLTLQVSLPSSKYGDSAARVDFFGRMLERLRTVPGVIDAAAVTRTPLSGGGGWAMEVTPEGQEPTASGAALSAATFAVTPRYFRMLGVPLLQGRDFTEQDRGDAPLTLIVNEAFASRFWPGEEALGKRFRPGTSNPFGTVIGVVGNVRHAGLEGEPAPAFYFAHGHIGMPALTVAVRTSVPSDRTAAALRARIHSLDGELPIYNVRPMQQNVDDSAGQPRFRAALLSVFSGVALLLAAVGIYGVMAYTVTQRTHEIGVRMALGARASDVLKLGLREGLVLSLIGVAFGLALALGLTRFLSELLYDVGPTDPPTFAAISVLLVGVTLGACYIPARRATKVDPLVALRCD
jgi:putative ABC transport system permease protein